MSEQVTFSCPSCGERLAGGAILCVHCGFNLHSREKVGTQVNSAERSSRGRRTVRTLGGWVSIPVGCAIGVGLLHGFSPYLDQYTGQARWDRQRAERLLEEYDLSERIVRGGAFGFAGGLVVMGLVGLRRWQRGGGVE